MLPHQKSSFIGLLFCFWFAGAGCWSNFIGASSLVVVILVVHFLVIVIFVVIVFVVVVVIFVIIIIIINVFFSVCSAVCFGLTRDVVGICRDINTRVASAALFFSTAALSLLALGRSRYASWSCRHSHHPPFYLLPFDRRSGMSNQDVTHSFFHSFFLYCRQTNLRRIEPGSEERKVSRLLI